MYLDKKKAIKNLYRIPEKNLFFICFVGGSLGILMGMYRFHHKTKHKKFVYGVPFFLVLNMMMLYSIIKIS